MRRIIGNMRRFLSFDNVGLIPKFNNIHSRLNTNIQIKLGKDLFNTPFIPANIEAIGSKLADICKHRGSPIIFHKFAPIDQHLKWVKEFPNAYVSIGVKIDNIDTLYYAGYKRFCIDIAHGHSQSVIDTIKKIKEIDSNNQVIAGNVCTYQSVFDLAKAGADIIKIGVGPASASITRTMTGVGIPQFSAIQECYRAKMHLLEYDIHVHLIADGGIRSPRDAVLALAAGADGVMMGAIFAKTFESDIVKHGIGYKTYGIYKGQTFNEFMGKYVRHINNHDTNVYVEITKSANDIFDEYEGGLRSALVYSGTDNINDFKKNAEIFEDMN